MTNVCKKCEVEFEDERQRKYCPECRKKLKKKCAIIGIGVITIIGIPILLEVCKEKTDDLLSDDQGSTQDANESIEEHQPGEKYWNRKTNNWEIDGLPYTYRVTYKDMRDGKTHVMDYSDVDDGYEQYEYYYDKALYATDVTWDHIPPC